MEAKLCRAGEVLILATAFPPELLSGSKRPFRMAKYLPGCGYSTHVVTASHESCTLGWRNVHVAPVAKPAPDVVRASYILEKIQRYCLPYNDRLPWIPHAIAVAEEVMRGRGVSTVLSTSPPVGSHFAAAVLKRRYGIRWIADFRDPLYGNPWRSRRAAWIYDMALERYIVRNADAVIANTDTAGEALRRRYPSLAQKIFVVWNGYDPDDKVEAAPIPPRDFRVLAHIGSLGGGRHPGLLLDSIGRLSGRGLLDLRTIRLRLIGSMDPNEPWFNRPSCQGLIERGCLEYTGKTIPEPEARRQMSEADFLLLLDLNNSNASLQLPAKLFEYLRIGRPILAFTCPGSPTEQILANSGVPHRCLHPADPPERIDGALGEFLRLPSTPVAASPWFWDTFGAPAHAQMLAQILDSWQCNR
jgi:glycosyltransferase involved in cell wall biosynthesis